MQGYGHEKSGAEPRFPIPDNAGKRFDDCQYIRGQPAEAELDVFP